ncbi:CmpA/NrtA family ABC transporter substrate-binding protein [Neptuniibacter halophilus]|uniref:CmpA/NrtA family ABC transporter substrate-binding protein n=1 Tax=Neptuniibacter halophilus TaxID=651666 RepID=UPI00257477DA|nr:CmpA/NrtA family ABC transporter substrate-binding protein [Neptuniibacter halophilus]
MTATQLPEKRDLSLGFVALLDCAPLVVAREKGFFQQQGLNVILQKESSWASIRDKVSFGLLDGAQMLAPMPLAATLGLNGNPTPMLTALTLSQNGTAITLSKELYVSLTQQVENWQDDKELGRQFKQLLAGLSRKPVIATVYPYSNHHYQLRYWLNQHQIDTGKDIELVAVPPTKMLDNLASGLIDGYCVGEPWNSLALIRQTGGLLTTGYQIWGPHMEKVLGVTQSWADNHPHTHQALVRAIYNACQWCADPANQTEMLQLLALPPYLDKAAEALEGFSPPCVMGQRFAGTDVNQPDRKQGEFLLLQMQACSQLKETEQDLAGIAAQVFRSDLYTQWCD